MHHKMTTRFRRFYAQESPVYHQRRYETAYGRLFREIHHEVLREALQVLPRHARVLEVACGTGHTSRLLSDMGFAVTATDLTIDMMRHAQSGYRGRYPKFVVANAFRLPFLAEAFDAVVSTRFLHLFDMAEQKFLLREMLRVVRPGGLLLVDFDNFSSRWIWALPYLAYNLVRYRRLAPYAKYNRIIPTTALLDSLGVSGMSVSGVGGTHLIALEFLSHRTALWAARRHRHRPLRILAEQFVVSGRKRA